MAGSRGDTRGWQVGKSITENLKYILNNQSMCDVIFHITQPDGSVEKLSAHRLILSIRSPVFEAMFGANFMESSRQVDIVDSELSSFKEMLTYIYCEEVSLSDKNVLQILNLARKYIIAGLVKECATFLQEQLTVDNVCGILNHAVLFQEDDLTEKCLEFAWSHASEVVKLESFYATSQPALMSFLRYDRRESKIECTILEACLEWARQNNDDGDKYPRAALGDCLYQIRFSSLTSDEFIEHMNDSALLTSEEKCMFMFLLSTGNDRYQKQLAELGFNMTPPAIFKIDLGVRLRGTLPSYQYKHMRTKLITEVLYITTNKPLMITHLGVFCSASAVSEAVVVDVLWNECVTNESTPFTYQSQRQAKGMIGMQVDNLTQAMMAEPIHLEAGVRYEFTFQSMAVESVKPVGDINYSSGDINVLVHSKSLQSGIIAQITFQRDRDDQDTFHRDV